MRRLLCAAVLAFSVAGCASMNPKVVEFRAWVQVAQAQAKAGEIKYSAFYTEAYDRLKALPVSGPDKTAMMQAYAELIPVARAYEAGQITQVQFDDAKRIAEMSVKQQSDAMDEQRRLAFSRAMTNAAENMRRSQPVQTNCYSNGGFTNCTSR